MKLWTHSYPAHPKNGDVYLVETSTYLVSAAGDRLTSRRTVPFSALDSVPLVLFCRPNSWRDRLDQLNSNFLASDFASPASLPGDVGFPYRAALAAR
jgi:hypothetical protein